LSHLIGQWSSSSSRPARRIYFLPISNL